MMATRIQNLAREDAGGGSALDHEDGAQVQARLRPSSSNSDSDFEVLTSQERSGHTQARVE